MRKRIGVATKVCIYDIAMAGVDQLMDVSYCVQYAAVSPISVLLWR
jgi:hypothetical protein